MTTTPHLENLAATYPEAIGPNRRAQAAWAGGVAALIGYFVYIWVAFDIAGAIERASMERAALLALDSYAYKHHVELSLRTGELMVNLEGNRRAAFTDLPEWVVQDGDVTKVDMGRGYSAHLSLDALRLFKGDAVIADLTVTGDGPVLNSEPQDWMCDPQTPLWLAASLQGGAIGDWLRFHTGAPLVGRAAAMFAIGGWDMVWCSANPSARRFPWRWWTGPCAGKSWARIVPARRPRTRNSCCITATTFRRPGLSNISNCRITSIFRRNWNWCANCGPKRRMQLPQGRPRNECRV